LRRARALTLTLTPRAPPRRFARTVHREPEPLLRRAQPSNPWAAAGRAGAGSIAAREGGAPAPADDVEGCCAVS